jgi:tetratricopeptide (TPR) repeat protein
LELGSRGLLVEWRAMLALERVWDACAHGDWKSAIELASETLRRYPQCAEAAFASGYAGVQKARVEKHWPDFAPALAALQSAVELAPHRSDFWSELAAAQEQFKRELEQQPLTEAMRACGFPAAAAG